MTDAIRLCRDCRHIWIDPALSSAAIERLAAFAMLAECRHPTAREEERIDPVSGYIKVRWKLCTWHREERIRGYARTANNCGPEARYFEPKEPPEPLEVAGDDPGPRSGGAMAEPE